MENISFECPVCLDLIKDPVSLPCGHNFCMDCMKGFSCLYNAKCPVCRSFIPMQKYRVNRLIEYFVHHFSYELPLKPKNPRIVNVYKLRVQKLIKYSTLGVFFFTLLLIFKYNKNNLKTLYQRTFNRLAKLGFLLDKILEISLP